MVLIPNERGNALFMILIAIFLLAGVTTLITRTGNHTEETGRAERDIINITKYMRYGASIAVGIQQLLQRGCSENQISFYQEKLDPPYYKYTNPNSPGDKSCDLFAPEGAGLTPLQGQDFFPETPSYYPNPRYSQNVMFAGIGNSGKFPLKMVLGVDQRTCESINRFLNITNMEKFNSSHVLSEFTGTYDDTFPHVIGGALTGKKAGCFDNTTRAAGLYVFYYILLAR